MMILFLTLIWLSIWSFVNALVWRVQNNESIVYERSKCTSCNKVLEVLDLIPVISYIFLWWKCRSCKEPIWVRYIIVEIIFWIFFCLSWVAFFNYNLFNGDFTSLLIFLFVISVLLTISVYDILYLEIFDSLIIVATFIVLFLDYVWIGFTGINSALMWALCLYSFFFAQILIPSVYHAIVNKKYAIIHETLLSFFVFPIWMILRLFLSETYLNRFKIFKVDDAEDNIKTWIWWWDLRMAIFIWFLLWIKLSIVSLFISYLIWAIYWIFLIIKWYFIWKRYSQVPFIPFLSIWVIVAIIFWEKLSKWYLSIFYIF